MILISRICFVLIIIAPGSVRAQSAIVATRAAERVGVSAQSTGDAHTVVASEAARLKNGSAGVLWGSIPELTRGSTHAANGQGRKSVGYWIAVGAAVGAIVSAAVVFVGENTSGGNHTEDAVAYAVFVPAGALAGALVGAIIGLARSP